jgi:NADH-quinone oxidoreductase subunit J
VSTTLLFASAALVAVIGAVTVVMTRDVMRMTLGLGGFLLAVAGFFALYGFGFLALAQLFIYVGGVLVLVLFAVMLVHRPEPGRPSLESRHDILIAVTCLGFVAFATKLFGPVLGSRPALASADVGTLGRLLLGDMLSHFELAGLLLLAALVAVVVIGRGEGS